MLTLLTQIKNFNEIMSEDVRYATGLLVSRHWTESGNFIVELSKASFIFSSDGGEESVFFKRIPNNLNILIPRRRAGLLSKARNLDYNNQYCVKMIRESRSGKFACSELFAI